MHLDPAIRRRTFFRVAGMSAGLLAVSRLRPAAVAHADQGTATGSKALRVLGPRDAQIMEAIADRITFTGDDAMPRFRDTAGLVTIDTALLQLPPDVPQQLHVGLLLFEYGPPLFARRWSRFTSLGDEDKDAYLAGWEQSRYEFRQLAFRAVKNLAMLGYYSQDATWKGIHYSGPWAPRPPRSIPDAE